MDGFGPYHNRLLDWLWDSVTDIKSERDYNIFATLYSIPGISNWMDYRFGMDVNKQYLARHGISYDQLRNPQNLPGLSRMRSATAYGLNWVSKNLDKLYR